MLDTNILISSGIFSGERFSALTIRIADEFKIVLSSRIIDELRMVMDLKFPHKRDALDRFLSRLNYELAYTPNEIDEEIYPKIRDKKDYPILASAIIANVDVFITGDKDFKGLDLKRPVIMTVAEFAAKYLQSSAGEL
jgi:putative PIN family toxin of toxin-antitoxin system